MIMRIVTIARPFGAGGHTIGLEVSKRLGFELIEEEMVNAVAKKANRHLVGAAHLDRHGRAGGDACDPPRVAPNATNAAAA